MMYITNHISIMLKSRTKEQVLLRYYVDYLKER